MSKIKNLIANNKMCILVLDIMNLTCLLLSYISLFIDYFQYIISISVCYGLWVAASFSIRHAFQPSLCLKAEI